MNKERSSPPLFEAGISLAKLIMCLNVLLFFSVLDNCIAETETNYFNCAFNVTVAAQLSFGKPVDVSSLKSRYGTNLQNLGTLLDISRELENSGLFVQGIKTHHTSAVLRLLNNGRFVIVHFKRSPLGHFVGLRQAAGGQTFSLVDYPNKKAQLTSEQIRSLLQQQSSGQFLIVDDKKIALGADPVTEGEKEDILPAKEVLHSSARSESLRVPQEVSVVADDAGSLRASFIVKNVGQRPTMVKEIKGSCSCLRSVEPFSFTLKEGGEQAITAIFDAQKFDRDTGAILAIGFDGDFGTRVVKVTGSSNGSRTTKSYPIVCSAQQINFGVKKSGAKCSATVTVLCPVLEAIPAQQSRLLVRCKYPLSAKEALDREVKIGSNVYNQWNIELNCDSASLEGYYKSRVDIAFAENQAFLEIEAFFTK